MLLDDSGSMRDHWGETSAFQEAIAVVRRLVAEGERRPGTQQCTLLLLSHPERPLFLKRDVNNAFAAELENVFEHLECSHQALGLENGVLAAAKLFAQDAGNPGHFHFISDFRASDWADRPALRAAFLAVSKTGASIDLARTVGEPHDNLAVTSLGGEVRTAAAGVPVRLTVGVHNFGSRVAEHVRLSVLEDGVLLPLSVEIERLEAAAERTRDIDITFKTPGKHTVEVKLPKDSLPSDDERFAALDINVANSVLIIDGNPESEDGSFVSMALSAEPTLTGFSTRIENVDFLHRESLDAFGCIYLLNIRQLRDDAVANLADYVRHGGGVTWFLGDVVNPQFYNDVLYKKLGGLFPVPLANTSKQMVRAEEGSQAQNLSFKEHPIFRIFNLQNNPFIDSVRINQWIPVAEDWVRDDNRRKDGVATIAFLGPKAEPFAFERRFGQGRVLAFLSSAGPKWNDWARNPSMVVFHLELAKHMSREDQTFERRIVGEPIEVVFNPAEYLETIEIVPPDTTRQRVSLKATRVAAEHAAASKSDASSNHQKPDQPTKAEPTTTSGPRPDSTRADSKGPITPRRTPGSRQKGSDESVRVAARYADTDRPGLYIVRLFKDQAAKPQERWIAYNVPTSESDLKLATTAEILARLSGDVHVHIHEPGAFHWIEGHQRGPRGTHVLARPIGPGPRAGTDLRELLELPSHDGKGGGMMGFAEIPAVLGHALLAQAAAGESPSGRSNSTGLRRRWHGESRSAYSSRSSRSPSAFIAATLRGLGRFWQSR